MCYGITKHRSVFGRQLLPGISGALWCYRPSAPSRESDAGLWAAPVFSALYRTCEVAWTAPDGIPMFAHHRTGARMSAPRPALLCILDGWGWRTDAADNAIAQGSTPNYSRMLQDCPHALLQTSGNAVGLPQGQMGNSEVGHMNIGSGRVVSQDLPRIDVAIEDGSLALRPALRDLIA